MILFFSEGEKETEQKKKERERERDLGKKNRACESLGATQPSPQRTKRLLGPCDPKQTLASKRNHTGGLSPSAREGHSTWGALPQGAGETTCFLEVWSRKTGKTTDQKRNKRLYRLASKKQASEQSRENPKNARGPEWHPEETPERKRTHGQNRRTRQSGGDRKGQKNNSTCGGVCGVLLALSFVSSKKKEERETTQTTSSTQTLRQRERDKKQDLTSREFF